MTTWVILDHPRPDRLTVKYTSDDGTQQVTMPEMFWDQVTPIEEWLGRINPWPAPPEVPLAQSGLVGMTGTSAEPERTPPVPPPDPDPMRPFVTTPPHF
jgi:hypothetical protein